MKKGFKHSEETRAMLRARCGTPENRALLSARAKKQWEDQVLRERMRWVEHRGDASGKAGRITKERGIGIFSPEALAARKSVGKEVMHRRWHVRRGIKSADCEFCRDTPAPGYVKANAPDEMDP
jgi:hypothetical protein